jgi:hypothetical protein
VAVEGLQQQAALGLGEPREQTVLEAVERPPRADRPSTSGNRGQLAAGEAGAMRVKAWSEDMAARTE